MATRTFFPTAGSLDRNVVHLHGTLDIGATGAISNPDCMGFSVARTGTGTYVVTLDDVYPTSQATYVAAGKTTNPLLNAIVTTFDTGTRLFGMWSVTANTISTDGKFTLVFDASANTPQDPNSGCKLKISIFLKNSSTPRKGV